MFKTKHFLDKMRFKKIGSFKSGGKIVGHIEKLLNCIVHARTKKRDQHFKLLKK